MLIDFPSRACDAPTKYPITDPANKDLEEFFCPSPTFWTKFRYCVGQRDFITEHTLQRSKLGRSSPEFASCENRAD